MGKLIELKKLEQGRIIVDLDDLLDMLKRAASEKGIDLATATKEQKIALLKQMGYEKYYDILRKESEFSWLSEM